MQQQAKIEVTIVCTPCEDDGVLNQTFKEGFSLPKVMGAVARHYIDRALTEAGGNKTKAARLLGLPSYQTLGNWIQKYITKDESNGT